MSHKALVLSIWGLCCLALSAKTVLTFSVPSSLLTYAYGINNGGTVTGYYEDSGQLFHGFIRSSSGAIQSFDAPGVGIQATTPFLINSSGTVAGQFYAVDGVNHGFLRASDGTITEFDPPGSAYTLVTGLNENGEISGAYRTGESKDGGPMRGFVRTAAGAFTTFTLLDVGPGTLAADLNNVGTITGYVETRNASIAAFVRASTGGFVTFQVPGALQTIPESINVGGAITGNYTPEGGTTQGFVRSSTGSITTFQGASDATVTSPVKINIAGAITGTYQDIHNSVHGFLRDAAGTLTTIDLGVASATQPSGINDVGSVTGSYQGTNSLWSAFILTY